MKGVQAVNLDDDQSEETGRFDQGSKNRKYDVECFKDMGMIYTEAGQATRRVIIMLRLRHPLNTKNVQ